MLFVRVVRVWVELFAAAGGAGTAMGTGGMQAKLLAAQIAEAAGIPMLIMSGTDPEKLYNVFRGEPIGTYFAAGK